MHQAIFKESSKHLNWKQFAKTKKFQKKKKKKKKLMT